MLDRAQNASLFSLTPLMVLPESANALAEMLSGPISLGSGQNPINRLNGVAVVPVIGPLANRRNASAKMSYEALKECCAVVKRDAQIRAAILDLQSPGGEAIGAFEAADAVADLARSKPVVAVINGMAASAAYAIASAATKIVTTPSGVAGSIGVVMMHADFSRSLNREGVTPTMIFAGAHKVDGNPFEPLTPAVKRALQIEVDSYFDLFVACVARNRKMAAADVRATEARTYVGQAAVDVGLADEIGSIESVMESLTGGERGRPGLDGRSHLTVVQNSPSAEVSDEKARIVAILSCAEAAGREASARHMAFNTALTIDEARGVLATVQTESASRRADGRGPMGLYLPNIDQQITSHSNREASRPHDVYAARRAQMEKDAK